MIVDAIIRFGTVFLGLIFSALPGPADHTWLAQVGPSVFAPAFAFDNIVPLHELLTVLGIMIALSVPAFGIRLALFVYRHLPVIGKG